MRYEIDVNEKPTKEQIDEIRKAAKTEVVCDDAFKNPEMLKKYL